MKRTSRTAEDLKMLLAVASGREPADLYLDGATLLNVYSGELYPANVAIKERRLISSSIVPAGLVILVASR